MARHTFEPSIFHLTIGEHEPVLHLADGDTVVTWTVDATGLNAREEKLSDGGNLQTGPFFVDGAEPGDSLAVCFDRLWRNRTRGLTGEVVDETVVDPWFVRELPARSEDDTDDWHVDLERGTARLESGVPGLELLGEVPIEPSAGGRRRPRPPRELGSPRPAHPLRRRQRLRPGVHDGRQDRQTAPAGAGRVSGRHDAVDRPDPLEGHAPTGSPSPRPTSRQAIAAGRTRLRRLCADFVSTTRTELRARDPLARLELDRDARPTAIDGGQRRPAVP
jgi:hypothetical protein